LLGQVGKKKRWPILFAERFVRGSKRNVFVCS
jgi:hypothetical protein